MPKFSRLNFCSLIATAFLAVVTSLISGCSGDAANSMIAEANDTNVKRLGTMYSFFHLKNNFRGPKNEAEFKTFISDQDPDRLKLAGIEISNTEDLFVSERDNEPFVVRYGVNTKIRGPSLPVIFEATGIDGMRQVGFSNGSMQEVDDSEYDRMMSGKNDKGKLNDGRK